MIRCNVTRALAWLVLVIVPFVAIGGLAISLVGFWGVCKGLFWIFCGSCVLCAGPILCELSEGRRRDDS